MTGRLCRECGLPLDPAAPLHHWAHRQCWFQARAKSRPSAASELRQLPGQLSLDELTPALPGEDSAYLAYEAERDRLRGVA